MDEEFMNLLTQTFMKVIGFREEDMVREDICGKTVKATTVIGKKIK
eukprot:CAMPEP_0117000678 /NCGR_PEP_ID=MMETSP0472-20121206/2937_1 /TAXON_ID=693140 ORGANISM="Tiarina fusus, Strain LIS" /NCGR_SAMPLE_ID=MMETSP0472 /ASSEMBLY_ACC=CAM_ASM_000603 /LENGTH=45 /DNA_ID= /DNA_START= /DNA_END= /DNA_ORIENTATION=